MSRNNVRAERAGWGLADSCNVISAAGGTRWNFPGAVQFDVRRQVVREMNSLAVGQALFQSELVGGGINLAEVIDTTISIPSWAMSFGADANRNRGQDYENQNKND